MVQLNENSIYWDTSALVSKIPYLLQLRDRVSNSFIHFCWTHQLKLSNNWVIFRLRDDIDNLVRHTAGIVWLCWSQTQLAHKTI